MRILSAKNHSDIQQAARILSAGGIGAFPTETVYGLGADATSLKAVARIFEAKGRPVFDPLIVHIGAPKEAEGVCRYIPDEAKVLMKRFWPGPLTLVLLKKETVPDLVTAGLSTVAVRMPRHPAACELLRIVRKPLAAPSANRFGFTSPTTAEAVREGLGERIDFVLDGGACPVGIESTIIRFQGKQVELLRPGGIPLEEIRKALPRKKIIQVKARMVEAPGQSQRHYATQTPLFFVDLSPEELLKRLARIRQEYQKRGAEFPRVGILSLKPVKPGEVPVRVRYLSAKGEMREAAANLFDSMRRLDRQRLDVIVAERMPEKGLGPAMNDRLRRASCGTDLFGELKNGLTKRGRNP